jgi:hypothetical protein
MPAATAHGAPTFVRRTRLREDEYHTNFRKVDCETISRLTSEEATCVTSQMCKVYLSLLNAPAECWEREGVLRFAGEEREGAWVTAWEQLVSLVGVASATARKALRWMHDEGIVGYFAGKNGVGIRVFINRAASSIGRRPSPGQKNLRLIRASNDAPRASADDMPFNDSSADSEVSDTDLNPRAPKSGADTNGAVKAHSIPIPSDRQAACVIATAAPPAEEIVERLLHELVPSMESVTARTAAREHERTREWLESRGLPKAARVAQREAYNVLRQHGLIGTASRPTRPGTNVGRGDPTPASAHPLSAEEVRELAETCVAMLEVHGQSVDVTLSELSAEAGGILLHEDAPRVRELAEAMAYGGEKGAAS